MSVNRSMLGVIDYEKDTVISNLRKQVFELEQNEKNYNTLNSKYRGLQNDYTLVCEDKLRMEYEYKQRIDSANKQITELKADLEAVQQTLDDRINLNKKLYQDNTSLHKLSEDKTQEIFDLKNQLSEQRINNDSLFSKNTHLEKSLQQTSDELSSQKNFNDKLVEDN